MFLSLEDSATNVSGMDFKGRKDYRGKDVVVGAEYTKWDWKYNHAHWLERVLVIVGIERSKKTFFVADIEKTVIKQ